MKIKFSDITTLYIPLLDVVKSKMYMERVESGLWKGHCIFCRSLPNSFIVNTEKEIFYCFNCHSNGDIISFIGKLGNFSPEEVMNYTYIDFGIKRDRDETSK